MTPDEVARERARSADAPGERVRVWADAARRGDVSGPLEALEAIRTRANLVPPPETNLQGNLPLAVAAWSVALAELREIGPPEGAPGTLDRGVWSELLHELATGRVWDDERGGAVFAAAYKLGHFVPGISRGRRRGRRSPHRSVDVPNLTIALGVVCGSLVTLGAARTNARSWSAPSWVVPGHAWREVGSWSTLTNGSLARPARGRLAKWAAAEGPDRVTMDWATARAVALEVFAAPFERTVPMPSTRELLARFGRAAVTCQHGEACRACDVGPAPPNTHPS